MKGWSVFGLMIGVAVLGVAVALTASDPIAFLNLPGLALVLGGTFAATLTSYSIREVWASLRSLASNVSSEEDEERSGLQDIMRVKLLLDKEGVRAAEKAVARVRSPFLRTGLQLVIDGAPSSQLVEVLDWRIARVKAHGDAQADVFNVMAIYAPGFGMIGTILGLVNLLREVGGPIEIVGAGLALALITTFYGIVLANALFKPIALNLRRMTQDRVAVLSVAQEALVILADQHSAAQLRYCLSAFVDPDDPDLIKTPVGGRVGTAAHA